MPLTQSNKEAIILLFIELVVIAGLSFFFSQYYESLKSFDDVKWEKSGFQCVTEDCTVSRKTINIYRFGKEPLNDISLLLKVDSPNYEIKSWSVTQIEKSLFNFIYSPVKHNANGRSKTFEDDELNNPKKIFGFTLDELHHNWIYQLTFDIESKVKNDIPSKELAVFQIENSKGIRFNHENLIAQDYLRLYLIETLVFSIILLVVLIAVIWVVGKHLFSSFRGSAFE